MKKVEESPTWLPLLCPSHKNQYQEVFFLSAGETVCVSVCVCVREREREREVCVVGSLTHTRLFITEQTIIFVVVL